MTSIRWHRMLLLLSLSVLMLWNYSFTTLMDVRTFSFMDGIVCHSNNKDSSHDSKTTALIHMGPHKTGSSSLQILTETFMNELKEDGYHLPFDWAKNYTKVGWNNQVHFASCFLQDNPYAGPVKITYPCNPELLHAATEIGAEGKSMLVSTESFAHTKDKGQKILAAYLKDFDQVVVVLFYRRYFEWLTSLINEQWKTRKFGDEFEFKWETSIVDQIQTMMIDENLIFREYFGGTHDVYVLNGMLRKHFENVEVVNMHNEKDNNEEFFCEVLPNANRTCEAAKGRAKEIAANPSKDLIWGDLAYKATKQGMVQIQNDQQMTQVTNAVQNHQLKTLGLTRDNLPLTCPSSEALDHLLSVSLMMEESFFPEFYESPLGEESLRASFKKYSEIKSCTINADEALRDAVWIDFFKNFSY